MSTEPAKQKPLPPGFIGDLLKLIQRLCLKNFTGAVPSQWTDGTTILKKTHQARSVVVSDSEFPLQNGCRGSSRFQNGGLGPFVEDFVGEGFDRSVTGRPPSYPRENAKLRPPRSVQPPLRRGTEP